MYVKVEDNQVVAFPYSAMQLKSENPNTSFPKVISEEMLNSFGVYRVTEKPRPSFNEATQKLVFSDEPVLEDGSWVIDCNVVNLTSDEIQQASENAAFEVRAIRSALLSETDWYALSDVTMSAEMTAYRQALRDITTHANWPHLEESDWPVKP